MFSSALLLVALFGGGYLLCHEYENLRHNTYRSNHSALTTTPERPIPIARPVSIPRIFQPTPVSEWQRLHHLQSAQPMRFQIVPEWRRAIRNLMQNATMDIAGAQRWLQYNNAYAAVHSASMGVERMARALLHCWGIKPESNYGQAEPLRLLQALIKEAGNDDFEKSIDFTERITGMKTRMDGMHDTQTLKECLDATTAKHMLEQATRVVELYRQMIEERFTTEIIEDSLNTPF